MREICLNATDEEVRGLLAGTTTKLARPMSVQPDFVDSSGRPWMRWVIGPWVQGGEFPFRCAPPVAPFGVAGDRLRVREKWGDADRYYQSHTNDVPGVIAYAADKSAIQFDAKKPVPVPSWDIAQWNWAAMQWRSAATMPNWACRLTLEVVHVQPKRVEDLADEDARAMGMDWAAPLPMKVDRRRRFVDDREDPREVGYPSASGSFALQNLRETWDSRFGKKTPWSSSPWAFIATVKRIEGPRG